MRPLPVILAFWLVALSVVAASTQGGRGLPRLPLPDAPQQDPDRTQKPLFRAAVTRVEVSALVLDRDGAPLRGLTAADFDVLENGVPQMIRSFTPFTFQPDLLALPNPTPRRDDPSPAAASMPASNYYASASRVFALILDDLHVDARRTRVARAAARRLV